MIRVSAAAAFKSLVGPAKSALENKTKISDLIRSVGVAVGEIRYPIPMNMPLIQIDRVGGQLTGLKFAAPGEEPLDGNTDSHEVPLAVDRPRKLVDDYGWRAAVIQASGLTVTR